MPMGTMNMDMPPPHSQQRSVLDIADALLLHTASMLLVMGASAVILYRKVGLNILRKAWVSFDMLWTGVLVLSGFFLLLP